MSNWNHLYDLEPLLHTPPTIPTSKQHSYITCKPCKRYDSDTSSVSSSEEVDDFESPIWWDILDHEEEAITRYKKCLRERLTKAEVLGKQNTPQVAMTRMEAKSKPANTKTVSLPERCKEKSDHTHIVEKMQDSRDLAGPVEFCFWSLNGQPCRCGRC